MLTNRLPSTAPLLSVFRISVMLSMAALLISCHSQAQVKTDQEKLAAIDKIFEWASDSTGGCVCAVSQKGKLLANRAYGSADLERNVALHPNSVLDAGSVVKQFVAAAVLMLVEEKKLSLTDDIHTYITELPEYGHKITIDHLLNHTSGIRDWTGLRNLAGDDPDALTVTLRQKGLNFKPGAQWSYSNSGYVLLKEIVNRTSGSTFSSYLQRRIFEPLQMHHTRYVDDLNDVITNRAIGYKKVGNAWKTAMKIDNERGGGGALFSTAADLVRWNDALTAGTLGSFVTGKMHEPARLANGRTLTYARGLRVDTRGADKLVWHSGGAGGYSTLSVRLPEHDLSLAIMCNVDGGARAEYASRIFDLFLPPAKPRTQKTSSVQPDAADLEKKAGLYFNEATGLPLRLLANRNALAMAGTGPLVASAANKFTSPGKSLFYLSEADFDLEFSSDDAFTIKTEDGEVLRYRRAANFKPAVQDLEAYAGRFESTEAGAVLEIVPAVKGLVMRVYGNPAKAIPLMPADTDRFMAGMMTIEFTRESNGSVSGFKYSNLVVSHIVFNKQKECD